MTLLLVLVALGFAGATVWTVRQRLATAYALGDAAGYEEGSRHERLHWQRLMDGLHQDHVRILVREIAAAEQRGRDQMVDEWFAELEETPRIVH